MVIGNQFQTITKVKRYAVVLENKKISYNNDKNRLYKHIFFIINNG